MNIFLFAFGIGFIGLAYLTDDPLFS